MVLWILRPSFLAGKGAPGNLGAMVNGIRKGFYMNIAGGKVVKSILMAEDIANILPKLEENGASIMSAILVSRHSENCPFQPQGSWENASRFQSLTGWRGAWPKSVTFWAIRLQSIVTNLKR